MAIRNIITDREFLTKSSKLVDNFDTRFWELLDDMHETMESAGGAGIAAVQVGVLYRACIVGDIELINPEIISMKKLKRGEEACLSIPSERGYVKRHQLLSVQYQDRYGEQKIADFENFAAVVAQHELDHLDGILFTDRLEEK